MRRYPNPWVLIPVLVGGGVGGALGWVITDIGCRPGTCLGWAVAVAVVAGVVTAFGVGVVVVLALRSIEEYHAATHQGEEPPGPGCEVPEQRP